MAHGVQWVWSVNHRHAEQKMHDLYIVLVSHVQQFKVHISKFFTNIYQFVVVTAHTDAYRIQDLVIFVTTDDRQNRLLYPLRMHAG